MSVKKIVRSPISLLGVIGIVPRAKIVYIGSSTYTSELVGTGGSSVTTTLRTDILNQSGNRYLKGWTTTSGSTTINYNRGASVTLNDGQTLTLYPVYYADAKIVYSGANRKGTASTSYTQTVHATSTGSYSATLNKTYFRKLYNLARPQLADQTNPRQNRLRPPYQAMFLDILRVIHTLYMYMDTRVLETAVRSEHHIKSVLVRMSPSSAFPIPRITQQKHSTIPSHRLRLHMNFIAKPVPATEKAPIKDMYPKSQFGKD